MGDSNRRWEKRLYAMTGMTVGLALAALLWWHWIERPVRMRVPTQRMPSPNAYHVYVNARDLAVQPELVAWAISLTPQAKPSSTYPHSLPAPSQAPSLPGAMPPTTLAGPPAPKPRLATAAERESLLAVNAPALALARKGFSLDCAKPPVRDWYSGAEGSGLHVLANALLLEALVREQRGDSASAMGSCLDCIRLGTDTARGGAGIQAHESARIRILGASRALLLVDRLDADAATAAAKRMDGIIRRRPPYGQMLEEEKRLKQRSMLRLFSKPGWRREFAGCFQLLDAQNHLMDQLRARTWSKHAIMDLLTEKMNARISRASKPFALEPPETYDTRSMFFGWMDFESTAERAAWEWASTTDGSLLVSLALRAWHLEHGGYPASLKSLAPSYLRRLPRDPFAMSGTFRYKRKGDGYCLYSVGPDCKDNGGTPIAGRLTRPGLGTGDIVIAVPHP